MSAIDDVFPNNVVTAAQPFLNALTVVQVDDTTKAVTVVQRPLRPDDPDCTIACFPIDWIPVEEEMLGRVHFGPSISRYMFAIQAMVKNTDGQDCNKVNAAFAKSIRSMLYRDSGLLSALGGLSETDQDGTIERVQRWGVRTQRFAANNIQGTFIGMNTVEFWVETEITF